jgi:hypothetical protein
MALSKAAALRLASNALDSGAMALRGPLSRNERGEFLVGDRNLVEWLKRYVDQEVIIILAPVDTSSYDQVRTCGICGRDYEGPECPHCAEVRARLRGR